MNQVTIRLMSSMLGATLLVGAMAGCGSDQRGTVASADVPGTTEGDGAHHRMTADEIPADAVRPTQRGDGSVRSFNEFLKSVRQLAEGKPAPRPATIGALLDRSPVAVRGHIERVEVVASDVHQGALTAGRIELVLHVKVDRNLKSEDAAQARWSMELWMGDPVATPVFLRKFHAELGSGPTGAEVLLFSDAAPGTDSTGIYDGLVEDASATSRLSVIEDAEPHELTHIASASAELDRS